MGLRSQLGVIIFHGGLFLTTYLGSVFIMTPFLPLFWLNPPLFRTVMDNIAAFWFTYPASILEIVVGMKPIFHGRESLNKGERRILILNHRTYFDWLFLWCWVLRFGDLRYEKIILKAPLKKIPGPGWAMQFFLFLFLNRRWEADQPHMSRLLNQFVRMNYPLQLLIFPEGTDMDAKGKARSDEYAKKNGLPIYEYVLHPRTTGFKHALSVLRGSVDSVVDITVAYPNGIPSKRTSLLSGDFPKEVHFETKRYPIQDIPKEDEETGNWLLKVWQAKEETLKHFYQNKQFSTPQRQCARDTDPHWCKLVLYGSFVFWNSFVVGSLYLLSTSSFFRYWFLGGNIFYFGITALWGGFDNHEVKKLEKTKNLPNYQRKHGAHRHHYHMPQHHLHEHQHHHHHQPQKHHHSDHHHHEHHHQQQPQQHKQKGE